MITILDVYPLILYRFCKPWPGDHNWFYFGLLIWHSVELKQTAQGGIRIRLLGRKTCGLRSVSLFKKWKFDDLVLNVGFAPDSRHNHGRCTHIIGPGGVKKTLVTKDCLYLWLKAFYSLMIQTPHYPSQLYSQYVIQEKGQTNKKNYQISVYEMTRNVRSLNVDFHFHQEGPIRS